MINWIDNLSYFQGKLECHKSTLEWVRTWNNIYIHWLALLMILVRYIFFQIIIFLVEFKSQINYTYTLYILCIFFKENNRQNKSITFRNVDMFYLHTIINNFHSYHWFKSPRSMFNIGISNLYIKTFFHKFNNCNTFMFSDY